MNLTFRKVDLQKNTEICIAFRQETFIASFGSLLDWGTTSGDNSEKYLQYLNRYAERDDHRLIHIWQQNEIIGQLEFKVQDTDLKLGYVNLFYLQPAYRGLQISDKIHTYVIDELKALGCTSALLSASPSNGRAIQYYLKHGWVFQGRNPHDDKVDIYKISF